MARESCADLLHHALGLLRQVHGEITDHHPEFNSPDIAHDELTNAITSVEQVLSEQMNQPL